MIAIGRMKTTIMAMITIMFLIPDGNEELVSILIVVQVVILVL
ncbi:MAG: hypothetical protein ACFFEX_07860 [Candidatus Thorarchaeota archaeon]